MSYTYTLYRRYTVSPAFNPVKTAWVAGRGRAAGRVGEEQRRALPGEAAPAARLHVERVARARVDLRKHGERVPMTRTLLDALKHTKNTLKYTGIAKSGTAKIGTAKIVQMLYLLT